MNKHLLGGRQKVGALFRRLNVLLLSHVRPGHAQTSHDHEEALSKMSMHRVVVHSPLDKNATFPDLTKFDAIIIHYSIICFDKQYLPDSYRKAIQDFAGLKVLFIQDEYRTIHDAESTMRALGIDVLFSCVPEDNVDKIYGNLRRGGTRIEHTLTGYIPDNLLTTDRSPISTRPLDAVYRARPNSYALGCLAREKVYIADRFNDYARRNRLKVDISWREESRIYGDAWARFLASGRAALGTESGASICDFTGEVEQAVKAYLLKHPKAKFEDAQRDVLHQYEGNVLINTISPRAFEAIAVGTGLILFPGHYSGVLQPDEHYIMLQKDFSNFDAVVEALKDYPSLQKMADRTYDDIVRSGVYSYQSFSRHVDRILSEEWENRIWREQPVRPTILGPVPVSDPNEWDGIPYRSGEPQYNRYSDNLAASTGRKNVMLASLGVRVIASSAFHSRPHDPDMVLHRTLPSDGVYIAAFESPEASHFIEFDLGAGQAIDSLMVEWYSEENYPRGVLVEVKASEDHPWRSVYEIKNNKSVVCRPTFDPVFARFLRLVSSDYVGQKRMLLRKFECYRYDGDFTIETSEVTTEETAVAVSTTAAVQKVVHNRLQRAVRALVIRRRRSGM